MEKRDIFTKILAILGTVLVWLPVLAAIVFWVIGSIIRGRIHSIDFLMPAELFPAVLAGGVLLIWAALRSRLRLRFIAWSIGLAIVILFAGQGLAVVTGLASGAAEAVGIRLALVIGSMIAYDLSVVALGVGGLLLLRDLFERQ